MENYFATREKRQEIANFYRKRYNAVPIKFDDRHYPSYRELGELQAFTAGTHRADRANASNPLAIIMQGHLERSAHLARAVERSSDSRGS